MTNRLDQQIAFIKEIDKLKTVLRMSLLTDGSRRENTAEHSWHFALMVPILAEHAAESIDVAHTMKMALIHDLVEIDAGDTYCYDEVGNESKRDREVAAAKRIFGLLPDDQGKQVWELWEEFEQKKTPEAKYANAIDRINPFMLNYYSGGKPWKENGITRTQAIKRMSNVKEDAPKLWPYVESLIDGAVSNGWLADR